MYSGKDARRIDIAIGEKDFWGKGVGTEAIALLVGRAFEDQGVDVLHCLVPDYNVRSQRAFVRNGFELVKTMFINQPDDEAQLYNLILTKDQWTPKSIGE